MSKPPRANARRIVGTAVTMSILAITAAAATALFDAPATMPPDTNQFGYPYSYSLLSPASIADLIPPGR